MATDTTQTLALCSTCHSIVEKEEQADISIAGYDIGDSSGLDWGRSARGMRHQSGACGCGEIPDPSSPW
jgi:hypothetical protein